MRKRRRALSLSDEREGMKRDDAAIWLTAKEGWIEQGRKRCRYPADPSDNWIIDALTEILNGYRAEAKR